MMKKFPILTASLMLSIGAAMPVLGQSYIATGQYDFRDLAHSLDSVGQSTYYPGGFMQSFSATVFSKYNYASHPGRMLILSGDGLNGPVLFSTPILIPCLTKFYPSADVVGKSLVQLEFMWQDVCTDVTNGLYSFEDVITTYPVNHYFPPGEITVLFVADSASFTFSAPNYHVVTAMINCVSWPCSPLAGDGDTTGYLYWGTVPSSNLWQNGPPYSYIDMAYEIRRDGTVGLAENTADLVFVFPTIASDEVYIRGRFGDMYAIFNSMGQKVWNGKITSSSKERVDINRFSSGVYVVRIGESFSKKFVKR